MRPSPASAALIFDDFPRDMDLISMPLEQATEKVIAYLRDYYIGKPDAQHPPLCVIVRPNGDLARISPPFADDTDKAAFAYSMRSLMQFEPVARYFFFSEAWAISRKTRAEGRASPQPSQCDDRQEVILLEAVEREGKALMINLGMQRDWTSGAVSELTEDCLVADRGEGMLHNFFEAQQ